MATVAKDTILGGFRQKVSWTMINLDRFLGRRNWNDLPENIPPPPFLQFLFIFFSDSRKSPSPPLTYPQKTYPQQTYPQRTYPQRTYPQKTYPQKTYPQNTYPQKTYPNIVYPSNSNRRHHIYPVFGKRSIRSASLTKDEILHLEYHRKSRHQLYSKIEKYFIS